MKTVIAMNKEEGKKESPERSAYSFVSPNHTPHRERNKSKFILEPNMSDHGPKTQICVFF